LALLHALPSDDIVGATIVAASDDRRINGSILNSDCTP